MTPTDIPMTQVLDSSAVAAYGYDEATGTLRITWASNGATGDYLGVPAQEYASFVAAPSKGRYLYRNVRGTYEWRPL